ncbi:major histocompatibility complex class I UXA2 precursor, partial [Silurus meridionalis]
IIYMVFIVFTDTHSLEFQYITLTPQYTGFPEFTAVGLLDGKQFMSYSSSARRLIPKDWIKNSNDKMYWKTESENMQRYHDDFNNMFTKIKNQFDHSRGKNKHLYIFFI